MKLSCTCRLLQGVIPDSKLRPATSCKKKLQYLNTFSNMRLNNKTTSIFLVPVLIVLFAACSSNNDDPPFPDPVGFSLQLEGVNLATYDNGSYEYNPQGAAPEYEYQNRLMLSMSHNGGNLVDTRETRPDSPRYYTPVMQIRFYDSGGNVIPYPEERIDGEINPEGEYRLEYEWLDDLHNRKSNIEQHGGDGSWGFHLRADQPGETGIVFKVYRCEDVADIQGVGSADNPDNPQQSVRTCNVDEEEVFRASTPLLIHVDDDYEGIEDGRYPHNRHYRVR